MQIDSKEWRSIEFEGVVLPQSLMAITVLGAALPQLDDETDNWLWDLATCRGRTKSGSAIDCARYSEIALNAILAHRNTVHDYIKANLHEYGFDSEATSAEWLSSLNTILSLSRESLGRCSWSAPNHADDPLGSKDGVDRFTRALDDSRNLPDQNEK
jgi:hypothetical protein